MSLKSSADGSFPSLFPKATRGKGIIPQLLASNVHLFLALSDGLIDSVRIGMDISALGERRDLVDIDHRTLYP